MASSSVSNTTESTKMLMKTLVPEFGALLGQGHDAVPTFGAFMLATTISLLALYSIWRYNSNPPYPDFPFVGKDEKTKSTWQLKMLWVRHAKRLIYDTLGKVRAEIRMHNERDANICQANKPFQLMASTGPLIILPAHFMDEVRNDDRMTFAAA